MLLGCTAQWNSNKGKEADQQQDIQLVLSAMQRVATPESHDSALHFL
jgi:hypothetical protein